MTLDGSKLYVIRFTPKRNIVLTELEGRFGRQRHMFTQTRLIA